MGPLGSHSFLKFACLWQIKFQREDTSSLSTSKPESPFEARQPDSQDLCYCCRPQTLNPFEKVVLPSANPSAPVLAGLLVLLGPALRCRSCHGSAPAAAAFCHRVRAPSRPSLPRTKNSFSSTKLCLCVSLKAFVGSLHAVAGH